MPALTQILGHARVDDLLLAGCLLLAATGAVGLIALKFSRAVDNAGYLPPKEATR
jgi:hypothetical protein